MSPKHNQKVSTQTAGTIAMGVTSETGQAKQVSVTETGDRDALDIVLYDDSGNQITTFGGGTQYTEGDTDATLTGTISMAEGPSDTATPLQVDASKHLQVDIAADSVGIGGGTQYTEDDAAAANPSGNAQILVRQDTPGTLVSTDGDNVARRGTNYGAAFAQILDSSGNFVDTFGGGTQYTEGDTDATITGTVALAENSNEMRPLQVDNSDYLRVNISDTDAVVDVNINNASVEVTNDIGDPLAVQGTVTSKIAGTYGGGNTDLAYVYDLDTGVGNEYVLGASLRGEASGGSEAIPGDGTDGLLVNLGSNNDVTVAGVATAANQLPDGHNVTVDNAAGAAAVNIQDGGNSITVDGTVTANAGSGTFTVTDDGSFTLAANSGVDIGDVDVTSMPDVTQATASNLNAQVVGEVAHDAADSGNPLKLGGRASAEAGKTAVAADDRVDAHFDTKGHLGTTIFSHDGSQALDVIDVAGFGGLFNIPADLSGHALDITSNGEIRAHVYSTDQTEGNADYALIDSSGNAQVVGNVDHDAADSGNPVKVGGVATDWDPDSDAEQGPSDVAAGDRAEITTDRQGAIIERVNSRYHAPNNVSTTYNNTTTTATSTAIECFKYRFCSIGYSISASSTPTDIQIFVETSLDGTNYNVLTNDALGSLIYTDTNVSGGIDEAYQFPIAANDIRIRIVATGTDASNTFTVSNFTIYLRN